MVDDSEGSRLRGVCRVGWVGDGRGRGEFSCFCVFWTGILVGYSVVGWEVYFSGLGVFLFFSFYVFLVLGCIFIGFE